MDAILVPNPIAPFVDLLRKIAYGYRPRPTDCHMSNRQVLPTVEKGNDLRNADVIRWDTIDLAMVVLTPAIDVASSVAVVPAFALTGCSVNGINAVAPGGDQNAMVVTYCHCVDLLVGESLESVGSGWRGFMFACSHTTVHIGPNQLELDNVIDTFLMAICLH